MNRCCKTGRICVECFVFGFLVQDEGALRKMHLDILFLIGKLSEMENEFGDQGGWPVLPSEGHIESWKGSVT